VSGLVTVVDLCGPWIPRVRPGWRGPWPCPGELVLRAGGEPVGLAQCSCPCHAGGPPHELPPRADRTAVHPTDVLADA
jgi:hypothetical protein